MMLKKINRTFFSGLVLTGLSISQATGLAKAKEKPNFTEDVAKIIFNNCTECHRAGQAAPFELSNYNNGNRT